MLHRGLWLLPLLALILLLATPPASRAESPADQLRALAVHVDAASSLLGQGNVAGARAEFKQFNDGWFTIEDGVKAQSAAAYRNIESALADAKFALNADPPETRQAATALAALRSACDDFLAGRAAPSTGAEPATKLTLPVVTGYLDQARQAIQSGDTAGAATALAAFRHDWPEVEGAVKTRSPQAYADTEDNMARATALLTGPTPDPVQADAVIARMRQELAPFAETEARYGVVDAAIILLREGLEALLVVTALLAFLYKTGNGDKRRWIWAGSGIGVAASLLVAILVTLVFAQAVGTSRELLEGGVGLFAAVMLIYVSYWLHSKASLGAWQKYIADKSLAALKQGSLFSLASIAFLAVFREGGETVLFYVGIAPSISLTDLLLGLGLATVALAAIGVLILTFGVRVPIRPFFLGTSVLIYYLAFKFVGTGVHALQIAEVVPANPIPALPAVGFFGFYPTWETALAQLALLLLGVATVLILHFRSSHGPVAPSAEATRPVPGAPVHS